jgi:multidrug efflux pump subunit AcrA (membrane-fusion protein)
VVFNDSQAINAQSGTLLVQLQLDNAAGRLKPGQYVQAEFKLPADAAVVSLPATSVMYRANGPQVAVIDGENRARIRPVTLGKDFGTRVQIASGVAAGQRVVDNPPDALADGDKVKVAAAKGAKSG